MFVSIHTLSPLPLSALNRDDQGRPKVTSYAGIDRLTLSSQSQKAAIRKAFAARADDAALGVRTKQLAAAMIERAATRGLLPAESGLFADEEALLAEIRKSVGVLANSPKGKAGPKDSALMFLSVAEIDALLDAMAEAGGGLSKAAAVKAVRAAQASLDIAAFGRMFAAVTDLSVDGAVQVAYALGTGPVSLMSDFFSARDDRGSGGSWETVIGSEPSEEVARLSAAVMVNDTDKDKESDPGSGAAMLGTKEAASGTIYRYATIDLDRLAANLGGDVDLAARGARLLAETIISTLPSGAQSGYAAHVRPSTVVVSWEDAPLSWAPAVESPAVTSSEAEAALNDYVRRLEAAYGPMAHRRRVLTLNDATSVANLGEVSTLAEILDEIGGQW